MGALRLLFNRAMFAIVTTIWGTIILAIFSAYNHALDRNLVVQQDKRTAVDEFVRLAKGRVEAAELLQLRLANGSNKRAVETARSAYEANVARWNAEHRIAAKNIRSLVFNRSLNQRKLVDGLVSGLSNKAFLDTQYCLLESSGNGQCAGGIETASQCVDGLTLELVKASEAGELTGSTLRTYVIEFPYWAFGWDRRDQKFWDGMAKSLCSLEPACGLDVIERARCRRLAE